MYDLGGNVPLKITLYAADGVTPTNAASVVITVTLPDNSTQTPSVSNPSTGVYTATGPSTQQGRYRVRYVTTNPTDAKSDVYDVYDMSLALLSLADARDTLNYDDGDTQDDEEVLLYVGVATRIIERLIGPVIPRTVTEDVQLEGDGFFTRHPPVQSLTSLTPVRTNGVTYTAADFQVLSTGKIVRKDGAWLLGGWYTVVYQAGRTGAVDSDTLQAARVLLKHLWDTQRPQGVRPGLGNDDTFIANYTIPNRVMELIQTQRYIGVS